MKYTWCFALLLLGGAAFAHTRLDSDSKLKPRNDEDGLKTPPCGGVAPVAPADRNELKAGEEITVKWEETIDHPGYYKISFDDQGQDDFELLKEVEDNQDGRIEDGNYHEFSTTITVPDVECEECTFQLIQVMEEDPDNPSEYYSCADVVITRGGDGSQGEEDDPDAGDEEDDADDPGGEVHMPAPTGVQMRWIENYPGSGGQAPSEASEEGAQP